ncbi:bifunctional folylpolyglutamate synthase/dihydrofolate synthase [Adhaeribacter radiodurans]|uniref:Dihydrofolate synthase/folylpolyglutamate synthase n=1 Tax=Adhaeribacter radiodurans TaxID=2745197 RepID=A0A7L7L7B8_9BACT|nr:folylpolyglutamate synthase/dihydrofolate synthase family protein [Adhaeribacter radiodurans]QMU28425.1 bifunctional folylpolyglutamate synthase/dihydrofolate synthase [Adhaeribacter radiodurans]
MTYPECLSYLYQHLPMFHRVGNIAFNKGLENIESLCLVLDNPQHNFKSVHVAGTNGKGSSSNMLAAVLQQAGYKTGLYTSPHLKEFTERIKINGKDIPQEYVVAFVENNKELFARIKPSFFEMTVALAFKYFADEQVDIAIVEVGLGGRLDSTNIITPLVSLITNISLDHQSLLGDDLPSIALEKAGIIKPNVPVVISKTQPEVSEVFIKKAAEVDATILFADQQYQIHFNHRTFRKQYFQVRENGRVLWEDLELDLMGNYQRDNLPGVLATVDILQEKGYDISEKNLKDGLSHVHSITGFKGRWQILQDNPLIICDTGHNPDGIKQVLAQLETTTNKLVHFVFGAVKDKDVSEILQLLPKHYRYYFCQAQIPRALPVDELMKLADEAGLKGEPFLTVSDAVKAAKINVKENEVIFIGGSTFVVAEIEEL